ncbi:MAG: winged helix DNA-binding domain-containing protein [Solirubrobacterales bacterium]|nr:winged helix DNA-binding domain-containing protein [Solirubrobacterales bacterium]
MGHAPDGRARCELRPECYDFRGDGLPVVLADGRAIGTWSLTAKGRRLAFAFEPFDEAPGVKLRAAIDARAEELAALLA